MDSKSAQVVVPSLSEPFKYQTWFLKVSIHCEGCRRKVKKVLQSIDGVFTTTVDPQQQKVTVTGSVGVETLIRKLVRAGKHAEIWPEKQQEQKQQQQQQQQQKKKKKKNNNNNKQGEAESVEKNSTKTNAEPNSTKSSKKKGTEKNGENGKSKSSGKSKSGGGGESEAAEAEKKGGESEGGKKKKGSGGSEVQMNLSPTRQQSYVYEYPQSYCYPPNPMVYLATTQNNRLCPSYYVSPIYDPYRLQSPPFEIFSDENANACSIM